MSAALRLLDEVREAAGEARLAAAVRHGLPVSLVDEVMADGLLTAAELDRLAVSRKTLAHRRGLGRLSPEQSDRLMRLLRVIAQARETFGGLEKAARWLRRPTRALDGAAPLDLLDTDLGAQRVARLLGWIDHGIAA
jgi:putative toxin-antitoxin system antitoxin component (TIGR02293 family)